MKNLVFNKSAADLCDFNKYSLQSLELDNDAQKRSKDEAISVHVITLMIMHKYTINSILYESQISGFYGKPDFIIQGSNELNKTYFMVSTTRAIRKFKIFNTIDATVLMKKKLLGLTICAENLECLIDDIPAFDYKVRAILHVLTPSVKNAKLCIIAYKDLMASGVIDISNIKVVITCVKHHSKLL